MKLSWFLFQRNFVLRVSFSELSQSLIKYKEHKKIDIELINDEQIAFDYLLHGSSIWNWHISVEKSKCADDLVHGTFRPAIDVVIPLIMGIAALLLAVIEMDASWLWVPAVFIFSYTWSQFTITSNLRIAIYDIEKIVEHWRHSSL
jgi:hypothetical protein